MDIHRSLLKNFEMPKVNSTFLVEYYERIHSLLNQRKDFDYVELFANPRVRTNKEIIWSTSVFHSKPVLLCALPDDMKERYSMALRERIDAVRNLIVTLQSEVGGSPLGELLQISISYVSEDAVYCGDGELVIVNWGLVPRTNEVYDYGKCIYSNGGYSQKWKTSNNINEKITPETSGQTQNDSTTDSGQSVYITEKMMDEVPEQFPINHNDEKNVFQAIEEVKDNGLNVEKPDVIRQPEPTIVFPPINKETNNDELQKSHKENTNQEEFAREVSKETKDNNNKTASKFPIKALICLLAVISVGLISVDLYKNDNGSLFPSKAMPRVPVIMPVNSKYVGIDADGMYRIATDRLNISFDSCSYEYMKSWAKAFKKVYRSKQYSVQYYNERIGLIQISIPFDEHDKIKVELPEKLKDFNFSVYDEEVYPSNQFSRFNDPALLNGNYRWYLDAVNVWDAWNVTVGNEDVVVAVVDNGFDLTHHELEGKVVSPYNVIHRNSDIYPIVTLDGVEGHGTHVSGTVIGNSNNSEGLLGIAFGCSFMPVQVAESSDDGLMSNLAVMDGVLYAIENGADVVNVSLGTIITEKFKKMPMMSQLKYIEQNMYTSQNYRNWERVYDYANENNCTIVLAAGNDNVISGFDAKKCDNNTIRVSALNCQCEKADFSNYGMFDDLDRCFSTVSAPGVDIYSSIPDNRYALKNGTSMAAPIVTGAVALIKSINDTLSNGDVISLLQRTGRIVDPDIGPLIDIGAAVSELAPSERQPQPSIGHNNLMDGLWVIADSLFSDLSHESLNMYINVYGNEGFMIIVSAEDQYVAPLTVSSEDGKIVYLTQTDPARSATYSPITYSKGEFICTKHDENSYEVRINGVRHNINGMLERVLNK